MSHKLQLVTRTKMRMHCRQALAPKSTIACNRDRCLGSRAPIMPSDHPPLCSIPVQYTESLHTTLKTHSTRASSFYSGTAAQSCPGRGASPGCLPLLCRPRSGFGAACHGAGALRPACGACIRRVLPRPKRCLCIRPASTRILSKRTVALNM